ncbi:GNAT family N-acetyltransferase [Ramlibacter sp.]|uniref:bifunctional acetate--CoA ligase family protein/GNAT family N-acetyltransferase n=1 Tax=Ramlibacter sp. TaxID=1917967 RepID=UPI003D0E7EF9
MSVRNLEALLRPASIAVIGASDRPGSVGAVVWRNVRDGGFAGPVWAVNPRAQSLDGQPVHASVQALLQAPDLAVICTPPATVPGLVAELGQRGTRAAVVITAGLRATDANAGGAGASLEQAMLDAARPHLLRILGPNCIGLLVPGIGVNASFAPAQARPGKLAFVTQSGALATAMLDWAATRDIGFSHFVSLGDSADVDFGDMLDYLGSDADTRAILMYVESVKHARKFMSAARAAARNKPVILVKAGRAPEGARAAASHTGALAGSDAVFDAAVRRSGMLRVATLEALFDAAETLAHPKPWRGGRLALLTNGGGAGVLAADALASQGGELAALSPASLEALDAALPATWSHGNPVDIIGDAPVERYRRALDVLLAAPEVDGVLFMHAPTAIVPADDIAQACLGAMRDSGKPVLACWLGGVSVRGARELCMRAGVPSYTTPERATDAWLQLAHYHAAQAALLQLPDAQTPTRRPDAARAQELLDDARRSGREWLTDASAMALLAAYGIPVVDTVFAPDADAAVEAARSIGYPVALKIVAREIVHKSDVGGVMLDIATPDALRTAMTDTRRRVAVRAPHARVDGFTVQGMVVRKGARELIVGLSTDAVFGPVMLFGTGGTAVELRPDTAVALPPLNAHLARELIARTHAGKLLGGWRGSRPADEAAVVDVVVKLSQIACDLRDVAEIDINPLLADAEGAIALDARVRLHPAGAANARPGLALRPYPFELEETLLIDGASLRTRPIRPEDGARLADFYAGADPSDMRLRFFLARREVPRSELARYCQIDYDREMTFIALDGESIAGEVRAICDPDNRQAEFAIQVATAWQGRGLGTRLLGKMVAYLRSRGTAELIGACLRENEAMVSLARHMGFEVVRGDEDSHRLRLKLRDLASD